MAYTFNGTSKLIILSTGTIEMSVRDVWSRWVDWLAVSDNSKYLPAFTSLGGDDIDPDAGTKIPIFAFLTNGWKIRPQEASHTLKVTVGILLVAGGGDPFVNTVDPFIVRINYQQPVQAIMAETGVSGLTSEESQKLTFLKAAIRNKKYLEKVGNTWYFVIRDESGESDIVRKALKDKNGDDVTDIQAGILAQEMASSV